jgi:hypothetical protein
MNKSEEIIIKGFLMGACKAVEDAREQGGDRLIKAESAYDIICRLAQQLKIDNPCEKKN